MPSGTFMDSSAFQRRLKEHMDKAIPAAMAGVDAFNAMVSGNAQRTAPVDTGSLAASAIILPAEISGTMITASNGFTMAYAAAVHENWPGQSPTSRNTNPNATAKFLEFSLRALAPKFTTFVGGYVAKAVG